MAQLIYSMIVSLDGHVEDERGEFGWGAPRDDAVHAYINEQASTVGTYLYGRRMYDTMVFWETATSMPDLPAVQREWALRWQSAEKVVYSRSLTQTRSARTRIEREFEPDAVWALKESSSQDLTVDGPELAGQAIRAGLVDEFHLIVCPAVTGGGKPYWPRQVSQQLRLVEQRAFDSGVLALRYAAGA